jgi:4-hydroxythreonine-4-phosphate dehydrogenase
MLQQASSMLNIKIEDDFEICEVGENFEIKPSEISALSGKYSYDSFIKAIELAQNNIVDGVVTMPIHKEAWMLAGLKYKGHTDLLREYFKKDAIMMLGCDKMFVALFTEHIPLRDVSKHIKHKELEEFFLNLHSSLKTKKYAVLGLNPHAGDNGVLGDEEKEIKKAIESANKTLGKEVFVGPIVPDIAFSPNFRKNFKYFVAMYHDQGLAPLKALYFDESINLSLNLPILRASVDHGTAFDIAYKNKANTLSYINAIKECLKGS